ncbi:MAG: hypothetical protein RR568_00980 [Anaerorhabdus sp.]|uniref:hypothetical protein n=1 Tax=Anaerorhabdus sp. TaxID=1872524 RepID=UPI002FCB8852
MNKNKILSIIFAILTLIITHLACIVITHNYVQGYYAIKYVGASAPASIAFLWLIPFGFGILLFSMLAYSYYKKYKNTNNRDN